MYELENVNWSVIGLSETKVKETKIESLQETGCKLFLSGNDISRSNGVGFLVSKSYVPFVDDYEPISDRLSLLSLKGKFSIITFIQCYFPTITHPDEEVIELYDQIQSIVDNVPARDHLFIMGDFNCKIGKLHANYASSIGKHTLGNANDRGELLAKFCTRNNLIVTNSMFQKKRLHTWTSPYGKTKNQIDFILTRKSSTRQNVLDSMALNVPDISDHRLVRAKVRLNFSWPKKQKGNPKLNLEQLNNSDIQRSFQIELSNRFAILSELSEPENVYQEISSAIRDTAAKNIAPNNQTYPNWMSQETQTAIKNKHKIRNEIGATSTQYRIAKAESKKLVKKDRLKQIEQDVDFLSTLPPHKQYYAALKKLKAKPKNISWGIKDPDGNLLTSKDEILERWATFYEELYFDDSLAPPIDDTLHDPISPILKSEVEYAIKNMKIGKSRPGLDYIYSEYLKAGGETLVNALLHLFNLILITSSVPQAFKEALIVVLFKKGSRQDCGNYRPISLLSHVYKLFISIIASRVKDDLYASFPASQAAYQPGRGTIEQIIALEQIIEKSIEFNNPVYIAFIDFTKAFDSVKLPCLWKLLECTSINKRYINLLKQTYDKSTAAIKIDIGISRHVNILKGVKQGDILSALLFCIVIASIILKTEEECNSGFSIGGQLLSNLSYADDIAAVNSSSQELQKYLHALARHSAEVGLFVNVSKTKCMSTDKNNQPLNLTIYDKTIEQVSEFVYLGHKLSSTNDGSVAVSHRIGLGWAAFEKNKELLTSKRVPLHIKSKIYNTYVLPVVLYGLESVNWTSNMSSKIETFQNHIMRFMTNHKLLDHIKIVDLLEATKLIPVMCIIKSKVLKLFGHVKRSQKGLSKICVEGLIRGKRKRGRPPRRWRDNVLKWSGLNLNELNKATQNRKLWKQLSHVSAQSAAGGDSE